MQHTHRFTVDDLDRMVEAGVLHPRQRVELIDGELLDVTALDRRKAFVYSRFGVPEYWRLELPARKLIVHRDPRPDGCAEVRTLAETDEIRVPGTDVAFRVADLLP